MTSTQLLTIFKDLVGIYSPTGREQQITEHITAHYFDLDLWDVHVDKLYNIMASPKGNSNTDLPLLEAHLDVHSTYTNPEDIPRLKKAVQTLRLDDNEEWLVRPDEPLQIGCDCKIGVSMALLLCNLMSKSHQFKVFFATQEESGRKGVQYALENSPDFFRGVPWALTLDRHGHRDIIFEYDGVVMAKDPMLRAIERISTDSGHPMTRRRGDPGRRADCLNIFQTTQIPIVNLSVGIVDEHSTMDRLNMKTALSVFKIVRSCLATDDLVKGACCA